MKYSPGKNPNSRNGFKKGALNPMYGKKPWIADKTHSDETKKRLSILGKGRVPWNKDSKGICKAWNKGGTSWSKGIPHSAEHKKKLKLSNIKTWSLPEVRFQQSGEKNPMWKGGTRSLQMMIRMLPEYKRWVSLVFRKDKYICKDCGQYGGDLEAHHKKPFAQILQEFLTQYSQFSPIEDKETLARLATTYQDFWKIDNGETFCKDCHKVKTFEVTK
jgi:hypothetical protein